MATPYMSLDLPTVSVTFGPEWATMLNAAQARIDAHDHSTGKGVQITPSGLNINTDLSLQNTSSLTGTKSVAFFSQASALAASFTARAYAVAGDLWWNDAAGNPVQITVGGALNSAGLSPSVWPGQLLATDLAILPANTKVAFFIDTTAPRLITLPTAASVGFGRFYDLIDATGSSAANAITVARTGGTDLMDGQTGETLRAPFGRWRFTSDGVSKWTIERSSQEINRIGVTQPTAIAVGNGLYGTGTRLAAWSALNLAGGANYVTGVLPAANHPTAAAGTLGLIELDTDLGGSASAPTVVQLTGSGGIVNVLAATIGFDKSLATVGIGHTPRTTIGSGGATTVLAQDAFSAGDGGSLTLQSGALAGGAGKRGTLALRTGGSSGSLAFEAKDVSLGQRIIAIGGTTTVTTAEIPLGVAALGDGAIYLRNTPTAPTYGNQPVGGGLMYVSNGRLGWLGTTASTGFELDGEVAASATIGASGAPPAQVAGYMKIRFGVTTFKIPYYNN